MRAGRRPQPRRITLRRLIADGRSLSRPAFPILTNGFSGTISLSCSSPSSLCPSVTFNPSSLSSSTPSTMTVTTAANTPPGVYTINVSGTIPGQNPVSTNVSLTVSSTPGAPVTITNSPSSSTFWVDGVGYAGYASFVPQSGGDTLTVTQTQPPPTGRGEHYQFSPDRGVTTQVAEVPPPGQPGGNGCPWTCSSGSCGSRVPVGPPQPAPRIQNVTDASGDNPAVLYPGVPVQITVNGSNFGGATGYLNFCRPGGSPCDFTSNGGLSSRIISWNPYQIVATVTLPTDAPTGGWLVYVSAMFWISGTDWLNPSMGSLEVEPAPPAAQINMGNTVVSGNASTSPNIVSVGQQIVLTGSVTGLPSGVSVSSQTWTIQGTTVASYVQTYNYSTRTSTVVQTALTQSNLAQPQVTFYWIDGDNGGNTVTYTVTYTATLSNQTQVAATAYFRPVRPNPVTFSGTVTATAPVINESSNELKDSGGNAVPSLNFGYPNPDYGIQFNMSVTTTFGGQIALIQLVNVNRTVTLSSERVGTEASGNTPVLDDFGSGTAPQYSDLDGIASVSAMQNAQFSLIDTLALSLQGATAASGNDSFQTYLMYQPPGANSIWVTLQTLSWSWNGSVSLVNGSWALGNGNSFGPSPAGETVNGMSSTSLPVWSGATHFLTYK